MDLEWRIINPELRDPAEIVAIDDVIHSRVGQGKSEPTLIFYHWQPSLSIGKPQSLDDLNLAECQKYGIKIVRTPGGGRAVLHLAERDISYSLITQSNGLTIGDIPSIYKNFCGLIAQALKKIDLPIEIKKDNDFYIYGKKISGNAIRLEKNALTQHGIILYKPHSAELMIRLMNPNLYNLKDLEELRSRLISVEEIAPHIKIQDIVKVITETLTGGRYKISQLTEKEMIEVEKAKTKYINPTWEKGTSIRGLCWLSKGEARGSLR